ncbi:response regulator transcription factor [soil metagenome]
MTRVLVVEDEPQIAALLEKGLRSAGFEPLIARGGRAALEAVQARSFDLVILDLGLPDFDGLTVLRSLRETDRTTPVVILTARDGAAETVEGLDSGADDYITKPFRLEVLLARIRARLRADDSVDSQLIQVRNAALDLRTRRAYLGDDLVELTPREFAVAEIFFRHAGEILSREQILNAAWGYFHDPGSNLIDVYVGSLRKKLGDELIETVRAQGYRLRV